ncbi:MAG: STAS domain-containing protein [Acidiferrobacterales bacterium]|nr:STAS domain-containing protein [Acidiferrobacterales bacterium]
MTSDSPKKDSDGNVASEQIDLPIDLNISELTELQEMLVPHLDSNAEIVINAENVRTADIAALQLLVSFINTLGAMGLEYLWLEPSSELKEIASLADVDNYLEFNANSVVINEDDLCPVF